MNSQPAAQDMATFLAYAIALEDEAAERYEEQGDAMVTHNNPEVGRAFHTMAGYCRKHRDEIEELAQNQALPTLAPATRVVVYCATAGCDTSRQVAGKLREYEIGPECYALYGGVRTLIEAGLISDSK